jgi:hypothetical protein
MAGWIVLALALAGLIFWQRRRLQRFGDTFGDGSDEYRSPDERADDGRP